MKPRVVLTLFAVALALAILASTRRSVAAPRPLPRPTREALAREIELQLREAYDLSKPNVAERLLSLYPDSGRVVSATAGQMVTSRDSLADGIRYFWNNVGSNMRDAQWIWDRMVVDGESFWVVVYPAFIDRELTKTDLRHLITTGLQRTQGSYRRLVELFRMAPGDYKRFLAFLYQHDCHLPFHRFREPRMDEGAGPRSRAI